MDLATIIGIVVGFGLIIATMAQGVGLGAFIDAGSLMIVFGGTAAATLIFQRLTHVLGAGKVMMQTFFDKAKPIEGLIPVIIHLAAKARKEGLVALANFSNVEGLLSVGNNASVESRISGQPLIGAPESGNFGSIRASSLEQSSVDLAAQFVRMIINQRGFQANTRTISVTNELLANLVSLGG